MFKPTQVCEGTRRLAMTTKQGRNYYKGTRTGAMGRHTKHGNYIIEYRKVRTYVVPAGLADTRLTPFVGTHIPPIKSRFEGYKDGLRGQYYLDRWKVENAFEEGPTAAAAEAKA